ncbi:Ubiquitin carboxyl-terminal hydrolase family protein [Candida parapsilosis]|uniref:ubiquitinyl hydrolase 1 n=1 Tax=Candida parapsilosis (strain CDC 317 / ATCC MYA-4646) TaxID=578454 RepID=G8B9D6_CANPC|nr:uncharacterized protein CPAR2_302250 [Candida parapsilosis]KAF6047729.1 Ubiquitin carboxyl-terminal hydrolase family protein [Candida parapsilosis]KAF6061423.1 Ubiquitin carboxyl-terminal hydrolase family protein [Candida parapsilosis]KAI5905759.1 Ubiquitin carboxyl-terminal hydrolase 11 [Candida parapsilosis]KAI5911699.1 Ubiquitin carboxyl-terminal hydrolase 11 [Candida parapsilosis]CAD1811715.1 unnamed protein product [Candida parapsilosis]
MTFVSSSPSKLSATYLSSKKLPPPPPLPPHDPPIHSQHHKETSEILKSHPQLGSVPVMNSTDSKDHRQRHSHVDVGYETSSSFSPESNGSISNGNLDVRDYKSRISTSSSSPPSNQPLNATPIQQSGSINSMLSQEDVEYYYTKVINYEFRSLQLDTDLQTKSLFDLIDYCESLYESANESTDHLQAIKSYTKGFLIFNYFINSFVMFHFDGFDAFIESNEQDFIIYLNIFAFYNTDQVFQNGNYTVTSTELRSYIKSYLTKKNLLSFDLEELYEWLFQYINYLREKDQVGGGEEESYDASEPNRAFVDETESSSVSSRYEDQFHGTKSTNNGSSDESNEFDDELSFVKTDYPPVSRVGQSSRQSSLGSLDGFKVRYPSVHLPKQNGSINPPLDKTVNAKAMKKPPPPIPLTVPPNLPNQKSTSASVNIAEDSRATNGHLGRNGKVKESDKIHNHHNHHHSHSHSHNRSHSPENHENPYPKDDIVSKIGVEDVILTNVSENTGSLNDPLRYDRASTRPRISTTQSENLNARRDVLDPSSTNQRYFQTTHSAPNGRQHLHPQTSASFYQHSTTPMPSFPPPSEPQHQPVLYPDFGPSHSNGSTMQYQYPTNFYQYPQQYHQSNYPQLYAHPSSHGHPMIPAHVLEQQEQIKSRKMSILKDYAICGLRNFGSSCYINSTIQMLFGVYSFKVIFNRGYQKYVRDPSFVKVMQHPNSHKKDSVLLSEAIAGLLRTFQQNGGVSVSPTKFIRVTSLLKPNFNIPHEQQDSQEFLLFLLERLHAELCDKTTDNFDPAILCAKWNINVSIESQPSYFKWWKSLHEQEGSSPISDLFQGHLQNKLRCNKCGYESITYSTFSILSLPIPNTKRANEVVDLTSCLSYYIQDETLSGENAWRCPKCHGEVPTVENHPVFVQKKGLFKLGKSKKSSSTSDGSKSSSADTISTKSLSFVKLPPVLFIHLSRFSMYNLTDKLNTPIRYPIELHFNNEGHKIVYKISGVINHYGNLKSGHYTALINKSTVNESKHDLENLKHPCWCNFDDENVRPNLSNGTLRFGVDGRGQDVTQMISTDVYVLCYERVDA